MYSWIGHFLKAQSSKVHLHDFPCCNVQVQFESILTVLNVLCIMFQKHASESTSSFEQKLQVMLHRMGVSKTPPADAKASQVGWFGWGLYFNAHTP